MIDIKPLEGDEAVTFKGCSLRVSVLDFWRWSYSDLKMPTVRGDFAEFLVFQALRKCSEADIGIPVDYYQTRMGWDMVDLTYGRGIYEARDERDYFCPSTAHGWGVEVKSSSTANAKTPRFDVTMKKGYHVPLRREIAHLRNWSDIYVFALLNDADHQTSVTEVQAWTFYLLPTYSLDLLRRVTKKRVNSVSVTTLLKIGAVQCSYRQLRSCMLLLVDEHYPKLKRWKFAHNELKMRYFTPGRPKKLGHSEDVEVSA